MTARPFRAGPRVARLVERIRANEQKWYERGQAAGEHWALDTVVTRQELEEAASLDGARFPASFDLKAALDRTTDQTDGHAEHSAFDRDAFASGFRVVVQS